MWPGCHNLRKHKIWIPAQRVMVSKDTINFSITMYLRLFSRILHLSVVIICFYSYSRKKVRQNFLLTAPFFMIKSYNGPDSLVVPSSDTPKLCNSAFAFSFNVKPSPEFDSYAGCVSNLILQCFNDGKHECRSPAMSKVARTTTPSWHGWSHPICNGSHLAKCLSRAEKDDLEYRFWSLPLRLTPCCGKASPAPCNSPQSPARVFHNWSEAAEDLPNSSTSEDPSVFVCGADYLQGEYVWDWSCASILLLDASGILPISIEAPTLKSCWWT
jgi:hypothetical protein